MTMEVVGSPSNVGVDAASFAKLTDLVWKTSGIKLREGKQMLVLSRLSRRVRKLGFDHLAEYVSFLATPAAASELEGAIDAITTNVTNFFRHERHFDFVSDRTKRAISGGQTRFRYWSAACSSGEEPYSLAMTLHDAAGSGRLDVKILATDISTRILARAMRGEYEAADLGTLPDGYLRKYFHSSPGRSTSIVNDRLKESILFRHYNLSGRPLPIEGTLDGMFCRNVMIYFDRDLRQHLVDEAARLLKPGGCFFVGQSESLTGLRHPTLEAVEPSIFVRR
jgi:chemotaxis protein methyltransferase CheR